MIVGTLQSVLGLQLVVKMTGSKQEIHDDSLASTLFIFF